MFALPGVLDILAFNQHKEVGPVAVKRIIVSDLSGKEVDESAAATIVITDHPSVSGPVEIDVTRDEASAIDSSKIDLVSLLVYDGGSQPRRVIMSGKDFEGLFKADKADDVLKNARRAEGVSSQPKRRRSSSGSTAKRVDYTAMENIGLIHRGKVTDEEARLVRENMAQANKNREREGQPKIGEDPKDAERYGLS